MPSPSQDTPVQTPLPTLFARYLERRAVDAATGLLLPEGGEVVPFESASVQPVDPRLAWDEARAAVYYYDPLCNPAVWKTPVEWAMLIAAQEPVASLPFCLGNFPQLVRDVHALIQARESASLRSSSVRALNIDSVEPYAQEALRQKQYGRFLLAAGISRLAKQFDLAQRLLEEHQRDMPAQWQAGWANERAALAWHQGQADEARKLWEAQEPSVPVCFNRGLAALFSDRIAEAKTALVQAVDKLPDDSAWHHLGRLYLALASLA